MLKPASPANEIERLQALIDLAILDTPHEERFDRLTRIAQRVFGVPIALVSLIDANRQWFKSSQGLDASETPRDVSFCGHAILGDEAFVVPDATCDDRFSDNPLVTGPPQVTFYAGQPLHSPSGHKIGTLCLIDKKPRTFGGDDAIMLQDLAALVESELSTVQLYEANGRLAAAQRELARRNLTVRESEFRLNEAQHIASVGSWEVDAATGQVSWSDEQYRLYGWAPGEIVVDRESALARVHPEDRPGHLAAWQQALQGSGSLNETVRALHPEKGERILQIRGEITRDGNGAPVRAYGTTQDVTRQVTLMADLQAARAEADAANAAKSDFLAGMSHELRTPLNAILGYSEMLIEDLEERGLPEVVPDLERINAAGRHLLGLINDVLDLSKVEAGMMVACVEPVDLPAFLKDVADMARPSVERRANALTVAIAPDLDLVQTDPTRLRQALLNLLSNAGKFTEAGHITLSAEAVGPHIRLQVTDTGIGMTPEQVSRLFQRFSQAESTTSRDYGGTGLGLALSRAFAHLLGGEITVTSAPGQGTTMTLLIAARLDEVLVQATQAEATASARQA